MSNLQNNAKPKQPTPAPLPPPQQQQHPQQYQYPQHTQYPYTNPYYYSYYNTYPQTQPPPPPSHTNLPPPPPPNAYYNPYFPNPLALPPPPQTWLRNPNNPPPPPPKPLISPNHTNNTNTNNTNKNSNLSNGNNAIHPPALQLYIEKCWNRFKSLPPHLSTSQEQHKLQKQLKGRVQETKSNKTLFTIDWKNEQYPPHLRHLIEIATKANSNSNSHKKRKSQSGWIESKSSRKVAKISMSHRAVHQMDKNTKKFLQSPIISNNKCDSDMSCSDHDSETNHNDNHNHNSINFQIQRNDKVNNKLKFKNPFNIDEESTDGSEEREAYVFTKGRGFSTQKIKKRMKKSHKKKKKNKKHKKKAFSWNAMDGIDALNTDNNKNSHNHNDDDDDDDVEMSEFSEISRILERKKRFESKQQENKNKNKHKKSKKHSNISVGVLSRDMQQLMEWHNKRVQGTCTKVEKDYFRLTCEPNPCEVRTLDTMEKAFSLLMIRWKTKNKKRDYLYVGGQFKSLRQDLRVQHIRNGFSVGVYEENARICLEVGDLSEYNQCQGQLKELYAEMEVFANNYVEFLSYRLLYEAVTKNFDAVSRITKIEKQHCRNTEIVNTLKIIDAIQRTDYYNFFKIYNVLRYHGQCIINQIIYKIRYQTLCRIAVSYCPSTYPIKKLIKTIGFKSEKECIQYLRNTGCVLQRMEKKLVLNCKASRGKIKEFIPKSEDDELGVTHGSVYHAKNQDETISIVNFLRKT